MASPACWCAGRSWASKGPGSRLSPEVHMLSTKHVTKIVLIGLPTLILLSVQCVTPRLSGIVGGGGTGGTSSQSSGTNIQSSGTSMQVSTSSGGCTIDTDCNPYFDG